MTLDLTLRSEKSSPLSFTEMDNNLQKLQDALNVVDGIKNLKTSGGLQHVKGFYVGSSIGGGEFYYDASLNKSQHNGGTIIAPEAISAWNGTQADIATLLNWTGSGNGCFVRLGVTNNNLLAVWFGAGFGIAAKIDHLPINAALNSLESSFTRGGTVHLTKGVDYKIDGTLFVSAFKTLDFNGALVYADGIVEAIRLGAATLSSNLAIQPNVLNMNLILTSVGTIGVHACQTTEAKVTGYIEGVVGSTGRNLGVWIDGGNASSFFNEFDVRCNHVYEGFRVKTSGSVHATNQIFKNCHVLGDYIYGNTGSIGINFGADSSLPEGEGSTILGGNLEQCGIGIYISEASGPITSVGTRFENDAAAIDILFKGAYIRSHTFVNPVAVKNIVYESVVTSDATIINNNGVDGTSGITRKVKGGYQYQDQQTFIGTKYGVDGTGYVLAQAGYGSLITGASHTMYAQSHPTKAGRYEISTTVGGDFRVGQDLFNSAGDYFKVSTSAVTAARDNAASCGSAPERFTQFFAATTTISTSDAREKTPVRPMTLAEIEASKLLAKELGFFKWLTAIEEKGDKARWHCGITVQKVIEILESQGLNAFDYAMVCYDEWEAVPEIKEVVQIDIDSDGNPIMEEVVTQKARPAGNRYSLRESQLHSFIARGINTRLENLENKCQDSN